MVADHLFGAYPEHDEGWLSRSRSSVVRASALADMAAELHLGGALRLGKGEIATGGREKPSILADALEAVIGAVYLDGGWAAAETLVMGLVRGRISTLPGGQGEPDDKSRLQELTTRRLHQPPHYTVEETGPEHDKTFRAEVVLGGRTWGEGTGRSKKAAEQIAAHIALIALTAELGPNDGLTPPAVAPPLPAGPARTGEATDA